MREQVLTSAAEVTPSDTVDLLKPGIGLYVGISGNVKLITLDGQTVTLVGLAAGIWHPIETKRIFDTLTTADSIVVGW